MKLKIVKLGSYRSKKGNVVFRYAVTGSPEALAAYKEAQGDFYRENEDGTVLWFTTRFAGDRNELIITESGKCIADMSAYDAAASISAQYGGNFGQEIAKGLVGNLLGTNNTAPAQASADEVPSEEEESPLDEH